MKRIVALLLSFLLAFGGIPVYAEENAVALSKNEIEAGGEVTLTLTYPQTVGNILYAEAKVLYDAENFTLETGPSGWTTDTANGVAVANYLPTDAEAGEDFSGKSVEFVFAANSSAKYGPYEFAVAYQVVDTNNAIHEDNSFAATLTIKPAEVAVESVSLNKTELSLEEGATETLSATVLPEDATDKTVTWKSSDEEVATVENGVVTAIKAGTATITAKSGEKEAKCEVTVTAKVVSEPFSYSISDIPSNGDTWAKLDSLVISGEAGKVIGHSWNGFSLIVLLDKSTPDDAVINSKANTSGMRPTLSGAGDITLENGTAKQSLKLSSPFGDICKVDILYTKDNAPVIADGKDSEITAVIAFGESYEADVSNIFTDEDGDELSYQVKVDDGAYENFGGSKYIYKSEVAGEHVLTFRAYDGVLYSEGTYTVKLKIENSKTTYDVNVTVPDGISPKFYAVNVVNSGAVVKGDELAFENGKVKVPENITRIMWEADGFAGMSASVSTGANLELVKTEFEAQDYFGKADTAATIEITDPEGVKISGKTVDAYLLPAVSGFTYKVTAGVSGYSPVELTEQTPTSGKVEIKLVLIHFSVIAPKGSVVSAGTLTGSFRYSFIDPIAVETEGETVVYKFAPLSAPTGGGAFIRVQRPDDTDAVTYWDWKSSKADKQTITITEEMLFMNDSGDDKFDSDTVYRNFEKFAMDLGDIYMNINNQGYINLNVGDVKGLNMFRNFQAINSFINDKISLPDFKYEIIDIEGKDVISIIPDKYNSAAATLTAKSEGTAIVLVTYDAMYSDSTVKNSNGDAGDGNRYTAIWPDRTGVFVVSVGKDGTAIKSNMTCNGAVFDAEHSPQFYIGNEGAKVSFTPDEGVTVTVNRSTVGKETLSFGGFTSEGVSVNAGTGEVTVSGLTTGRHIIRFEKDGVSSYQVVTAQQVTVDIVRSDGVKLGLDSAIAPGTALTLKIKGLTNPAEKFATKYNFNAQVTYKDEKGNTYKNSSGAAFGKYDFSSLEQIVNVTVPSDWEGETITLNGYIQMGGFSGGAIGDHRKVSYGTASGMATGSGAGMVLGTLPELVLNIGSVHATSISLDKTEVRAEADEPFALTATVLPENSTDVVEWISADETIATVKDGVVTGQSAGKTTITAKVGDLTAVCTVEVYGTKKEIDVETTPTANKYYFTDVKIKGVRGEVEKSEGTTYTILLDPRTKTTDTLDFVMTANRTNSSRYFWVNNNKLQTSAGNPGTISIVPDWNENNEAVVTIRIANSGGGTNYDGPHTFNLKIAPHDHDSKNEVADAKYLKSEATCTEKAVYWKSCSICGLASDSETFKYGETLEHTFDKEAAEEKYLKSKATCTEEAVYWKSCSVCGLASDSETFKFGEVLGHNWADATYEWAEDCSSCTATRVCQNDASHTETAKATVTSETKDATCEEAKVVTYTATFAEKWAETQTKEETEGEAIGHDWSAASYKWSDDGKACTATRVCVNDAEHVETAEATVTSEVEKEATCTEGGLTKYTATFDVDWAKTQTNTKADIEALGHSYKAVVTEPICTEGGYTTYTCVCGDSYVADEVPALGHDWEVSYEWAEDGKSCTATRVCQNDAEHVETAEAAITSVVAKPATCVTMGDTQYTATFAEDWAEIQYTIRTDIAIDKDAHEWDEWKVVTEPDYVNKGLEKRICKLSDEHFEEKTIEKFIPTATEKVEGPDDTKQYVVAYQEGVVIVPAGLENEYPNQQAVKDALKAKVENGGLKGEVNLVFREVTAGYYENGAFVPVSNKEFFEDGRTIDILLKYPESADENDKFEVYHLRDDGVIEKCVIKDKTNEGLVIEVGSLSPFAIAYESVDNTPNRPSNPGKPSKPSKPSDKPNPGITIITPEDEKEEANPNTGAPVVCSFDLTAAGVVIFAATAAVLEIKRRK